MELSLSIVRLIVIGASSSVVALLVVVVFTIVSSLHNRKIENTFTKIYQESECRIGRANEMINLCTKSLMTQSVTAREISETFSHATEVYARQVGHLQKQRDRLTDENRELSKAVNRLTDILSIKRDQVINLNHGKSAS